MSPLGGRSWDEWIARYGRSHGHPINRFGGLRWWVAKIRGRG